MGARRAGGEPERESAVAPFRFRPRWALALTGIFAVSFAVRIFGAVTVGVGLDGPGTFDMINYDEGNACEGVLQEFDYPRFVGFQIIAIASALGYPPSAPAPEAVVRMRAAKSYCESRPLIMIQRFYSAATGALTVVLVALLGLMMWPTRAQIAWTAALLLGLSNLHVAWSHWGTVDAPQVFFVLLLTTVLTYWVVHGGMWPLLISPLLLTAAVWTKYDVFAVGAYACVFPYLRPTRRQLAYGTWIVLVLAAVVLLVGWGTVVAAVQERLYLLWGDESGRFGTSYGHIGTWRRWIRNSTDLFIVHLVGIGVPACVFVWRGVRRALATRRDWPLWLAHAPAALYALYMLVLGPVTYYRHYLPLFPTVALLAAYGLWESRWARRRVFLAFFCLYPLLLTLDSESNYFNDPRRALRQWYATHAGARALVTYYVVPPRGAFAFFDMDAYLRDGASYLRRADYLMLSENWYDTSFPNELNGPIAWKPEWLIKTKPEYVVAYRRMLSGQDPNLERDATFTLRHFTPEFLVHRYFYGSFQLFVGDLEIFRIRKR